MTDHDALTIAGAAHELRCGRLRSTDLVERAFRQADAVSVLFNELHAAIIADAVINKIADEVAGDGEREDGKDIKVAERGGESGSRGYDRAFDHHRDEHCLQADKSRRALEQSGKSPSNSACTASPRRAR